ncbi:MAG: MFS transporter [Candidatus Methanomethylicaceae archaeon]
MRILREIYELNKESKYLIFANFFPSFTYGIFFIDAAYFLTNIRGFSDTFMGFLYTLMGIFIVIFSIPAGMISDRYGKRKVLLIGNAILSLSIFIFALTSSIIILIFSSIFLGIAESMIISSSGALLAEKTNNEKRALAFSFNGFVSGISFGLGGFIIPLHLLFENIGINEILAHELLYMISSLLILFSLILILKVPESNIFKKEKGLRNLLPKKSKKIIIKYTITNSILAFGAGIFVPLMTRWFYLMYGIKDTISGPVLGFTNLLIGLSNLLAPFLLWKFGLINSIIFPQIFSTLFLYILPYSPTFLIASIVYFIRSFLMNMTTPLQQAMILSLVNEEERGVTSGINSLVWYLPNSISIGIGAWLLEIGNLSSPFLIATILYIISILLFWLFFKDIKIHKGIISIERMIS